MSPENRAIRLQPLDIARLVTSLPVPTTASDGAELPSIGGYRPRRLAITIEADAANSVVNAPVSVHAFDGTRWRNVGTINAGGNIDATAGFEVEIEWSGAHRIDVSALSVTNGPVTVIAIPIEVQ